MATSERVVDHRGHMSDSTHDVGALEAYTGARPEVQSLVPDDARRVLDLGCSRALMEGAGLRVEALRPMIRVRPGGSRFDRWFAWLGRVPLLRELFAFQ